MFLVERFHQIILFQETKKNHNYENGQDPIDLTQLFPQFELPKALWIPVFHLAHFAFPAIFYEFNLKF